MRRQLWLVPGTVLGAWASILWHQYVSDVGCSLGWPPNGVLSIASSLAVGAGVLAIVYLLTRPPRHQRIAVARMARRHTIAGGSVAMAIIVITLAASDRLVPRDACAVPAQTSSSDAPPPPEEDWAPAGCLCGNDMRPECRLR